MRFQRRVDIERKLEERLRTRVEVTEKKARKTLLIVKGTKLQLSVENLPSMRKALSSIPTTIHTCKLERDMTSRT